ncbi:MAG TPA: glycine cleavage system aminomethyltransferase GcvT [Frankiaceae bacterium]|nr:glycine cleavage system aminomethyltransferase GcvT [Frankiaceae bacterium]
MDDLIRSPLHNRHVALGAKLAPFGGWEMPLSYAGTVEEHTAVRTDVGIFDVSHLGKGRVSGRRAREYVNSTLTNDLGRIEPGQAQYTLCCDEQGGVVDDLIAYLHSDDDVFLIPNAANTAEVVQRLAAAAPAGIEVTDLHRSLAVLAVQGPRSAELLAGLGFPTGGEYMSFEPAEWHGRPVIVCRSGYTGERGFELLPRWEDAGEVWDAVLAAGATPCGLAARDTLRTEMGYPLHGQDLSMEITPVQARLGWAVGWEKPHFWGRDALLRERADGPKRRLWGLKARERAIPRHDMRVLSGHGVPVGVVTSGTFSPTLRTGIALALLDRGVSEGDVVTVDIRGRAAAMQVVKPPFVEAKTR